MTGSVKIGDSVLFIGEGFSSIRGQISLTEIKERLRYCEEQDLKEEAFLILSWLNMSSELQKQLEEQEKKEEEILENTGQILAGKVKRGKK